MNYSLIQLTIYSLLLFSAIFAWKTEKVFKEKQRKIVQEYCSGEELQKKKSDILAGKYDWLDAPQGERWYLRTKEANAILHQYHPELTAIVYYNRIQIYHKTW